MNQSETRLTQILQDATANGTTRALAAAVGNSRSGFTPFHYFCGSLEPFSNNKCNSKTLFDLASLTKIFATTLVAAEAVSLGKIDLSLCPFQQWPNVNVGDLLKHTSGLPAWDALYTKHSDYTRVYEKVLQLKVDPKKRGQTLYSDLGFIALGYYLEKILKDRFDIIFNDLSARYFNSPTMRYQTIHSSNSSIQQLAAPTGLCPIRHRLLRGEVNDLNAFAMGGIAPHAGLFGTLFDVEAAVRFFLNCVTCPTSPIGRTLKKFAREPGLRAIGFDKAEPQGSTAGALSCSAVGHLGFTGTSFWIDPVDKSYYILLTNRLAASSRNKEILDLRRDFHRAAKRWLKARL